MSKMKGYIQYYLEAEECEHGDQHATKVTGKYLTVSNLNRCIFTGDTLQIGGCAKSFEGDEMLNTIDMLNDSLPYDTKIFCGYENTKANIEFCLLAEP